MTTADSIVEAAAHVAHEANRQYCLRLGDDSHLPWDIAPQWQKESARDGVRNFLRNEGLSPRDSHKSWLDHKRRDGWAYGPVKDPSKKQHPCMVPYEDLPVEQRVKDAVFLDAVKSVVGVFAAIEYK